MSEYKAVFSLDNQNGKLSNINIRTEKHGDEDVVACDLRLLVPISNEQLSEFHPQLRNGLFEIKDSPQSYLVDRVPTSLKFPQVAPFKWELDMPNCDFSVHWGVTDVSLGGVTACKFRMEPKEGGTVNVELTVQAKPTSEQVGKLSMLIGAMLELSLNQVVEVRPEEAIF